jgi:hypothetical protein
MAEIPEPDEVWNLLKKLPRAKAIAVMKTAFRAEAAPSPEDAALVVAWSRYWQIQFATGNPMLWLPRLIFLRRYQRAEVVNLPIAES